MWGLGVTTDTVNHLCHPEAQIAVQPSILLGGGLCGRSRLTLSILLTFLIKQYCLHRLVFDIFSFLLQHAVPHLILNERPNIGQPPGRDRGGRCAVWGLPCPPPPVPLATHVMCFLLSSSLHCWALCSGSCPRVRGWSPCTGKSPMFPSSPGCFLELWGVIFYLGRNMKKSDMRES